MIPETECAGVTQVRLGFADRNRRPAMVQLARECGDQTFTMERIDRIMNAKNVIALYATDAASRGMVACVIYRMERSHLHLVSVFATSQIALDAIIERLKHNIRTGLRDRRSIVIYVPEWNVRSQLEFRRLGFRAAVPLIKRQCRDGSESFLMCWHHDPEPFDLVEGLG